LPITEGSVIANFDHPVVRTKSEEEKMKNILFDPIVQSISTVRTLKIDPNLARKISSSVSDNDPSSRTELDSHADSPVVGINAKILKYMNRDVTVSGFTDTLGNISKVPIVQAAVIYDCEYSGKSYVLHINNALFIKNMSINLIPPFLMRLNGLDVNECPKIMAKHPNENHHSIYFHDVDLRIPLLLDKTTSYIPTRVPLDEDLNEHTTYLDLTPDTDEWNPHDTSYGNQEAAMLDYHGDVIPRKKRKTLFDNDSSLISEETNFSEVSAVLTSISSALDPMHLYISMEEHHEINAMSSSNRKWSSDVDLLMRVFRCSRDVAKRTLEVTTQRCTRTSAHPSLSRRFNTNDRMLRYSRISCDMFMDTYFSKVTSIRGYKMAQMFSTDFNFIHIENLKKRVDLPQALKHMFKNVGVPNAIVADGAKEQVKGDSLRLCQFSSCTVKELEKGTPWANRAELHIGLSKAGMLRELKRSNCPMKLWCYLGEWFVKVNNCLARETYQLHNQTPHFKATGQITDISAICEFQWYEWVYFRDHASSFPYAKERLGRYLGPADHAGTMMSKWILNDKGTVLPFQTLRPLTPSEMNSPMEKTKREAFDKAIRLRHGDSIKDVEEDTAPPLDELYQDDIEDGRDSEMPEASDFDDLETYINTEVLLPRDGEHMQSAKVIRRTKDAEGKLVGKYHRLPYLNTQVYDVAFPDGGIEQYSANVIAENIYSQVDDEGHRYQLLDDIVDHRKTEEATLPPGINKYKNKSTKGWYLLIKWKDGTESWKPLKDIKECYPINAAVYAENNNLLNEVGFAWWAPFTLRKRNRILKAVKSRIVDKSSKYGIRLPKTVKEALEFDKLNGDTLWTDAISKEMKNVSVAFDFLDPNANTPVGYTFMPCRLIFDVKMDFTRKARYVAQSCFSENNISGSTYAGVVSRESVRIAFTYAALHDLDVYAADIQNAYLQAPTSEKHWAIAGPEFGSKEGCKMLIVRALYGTATAGRDFRNHLRECMKHLKYDFCEADHDVWMRKARRSDGSEYYEYLLLYTDDCLCISEHAEAALREIDKYFSLKEKSIGPPKIYLGGKVSKVTLPSGIWAYSFSSSQYVQEAVKNVEEYLGQRNMKLSRKANSPISPGYRPELDQSDELNSEEAAYYQSLIGILRWAVELGRIDITVEVSMLSSHVALPREGHLQQVFHIFTYLKYHHNSSIVFDPSYPELEYDKFERKDWKNFYGSDTEQLPDNMPEPLGKEFIIRCYVDADYAGEKLTRKSRTGFIVYLNCAPIYWYSKKQATIETSSFGSEFVAMKHSCEYLRGLRFKLRMMGIPVSDPCFVTGDNQAVLSNSSIPESTLRKKSNSVAYHFVRHGCALDEWRFSYCRSAENPADIMASPRAGGEDRKRKIQMMLYDIYD
jgi:hypothetical protein